MTEPKVFQTGDVVKLRSGGPSMTVERQQQGSDGVQCAWFELNEDGKTYGDIKRGQFLAQMLVDQAR